MLRGFMDEATLIRHNLMALCTLSRHFLFGYFVIIRSLETSVSLIMKVIFFLFDLSGFVRFILE